MPASDTYFWPKALAKVLILFVIGFFWYGYVARHWGELAGLELSIGWGWVGVSGVFFVLGYVLMAVLWRPMLGAFTGIRLTYGEAFRASALSWVWRYVPGKIWTVASKAYLSISRREEAVGVGVVAMLETVWSQGTGFLAAVFVFAFFWDGELPVPGLQGLALCLPLLLLLMHPKISFGALNGVLGFLGRARMALVPRYGSLLLLTLGYGGVFLFWAMGFVFFVGALGPGAMEDAVSLGALFCAAWTIGVFSLFAPAGLGVRDSILVWGMGELLGYGPVVVIGAVAGSRLMTTAAELVCFLGALLLGGKGKMAGSMKDFVEENGKD